MEFRHLCCVSQHPACLLEVARVKECCELIIIKKTTHQYKLAPHGPGLSQSVHICCLLICSLISFSTLHSAAAATLATPFAPAPLPLKWSPVSLLLHLQKFHNHLCNHHLCNEDNSNFVLAQPPLYPAMHRLSVLPSSFLLHFVQSHHSCVADVTPLYMAMCLPFLSLQVPALSPCVPCVTYSGLPLGRCVHTVAS